MFCFNERKLIVKFMMTKIDNRVSAIKKDDVFPNIVGCPHGPTWYDVSHSIFSNRSRTWKGCMISSPALQQCVVSWNLKIFIVATWHYRSRHRHNNNCFWHNLLCWLSFCSQMYISNFTTIHNSDIRIYRRDIALTACPRSQPFLNMNIEGNFQVILWRHWWCHQNKYLFGHILGRYSHIWCQIKTVFHNLAFSKWLPFWGRAKDFYREWYRKLIAPARLS